MSLLFVLLAVVGENDLRRCVNFFLTVTSRGSPAAGRADLTTLWKDN
jgi:hypothetical protein